MDNVNENYYKLLNSNVSPDDQPKLTNDQAKIQQQINNFSVGTPQVAKIESASFYNPTYQNQYKPRYEATMAYKNIGFDPRRDNESIYNKEMSGFDTFQRAFVQMGHLMGYAALDTLTFGAMSKNTTEKFARANSIGNSTKDGIGAFAVNTMVSAGYTLGIIGEALLENIVVDALTLGAGSAIEAAKLSKAFNDVYKGIKMVEAQRNQAKIIKGINDLSKARKLSEFGKKAVDLANPLENITNFAKNAAKYEELGMGYSRTEKVAKGMTAMWNDVQAIRGAYTEALMEGNFAQNDMESEWLQSFQIRNGRAPSEDEYMAFKENAIAANYGTAMVNMPMIFITNKLTLSPLFRPISKMTGNTIDVLGKKSIVDISKAGVRTIKQLPEGVVNRLKLLKTAPIKALNFGGKYIGENFFEGAQETLQEVVSGAMKDYYSDFASNDLRGGMMDYMLMNASKQVSKQGLETFASGFLMQTFISPITHGIGGAYRGFKGDKNTWVGKTANAIDNFRHRNDSEYQENKKKQEEQEEKEYNKAIDEINFFFSNAANYFNGNWEELSKSSQFSELFADKAYADMTDAEKKNVEDKMHDRLNEFVLNSLQKGYYNEMVDQLKDMIEFSKSSKDELAAEIGEVQANLMASNGEALLKKAEKLKKDYDSITSYFQKPFSDEDLLDARKRNDNYATYNKMIYVNTAYSKAINDYVFLKDNVDLAFEKQGEILDEARSIFNGEHKNAKYDDLSTVFDRDVMSERINFLSVALNGDSTSGALGLLSTKASDRTPELKKTIDEYQEELNMLTLMRDKLNEFNDEYEKVKDKKDPSKTIERKKSASKKKKERDSIKSAIRAYLSGMDMRKNGTGYRRTSTYENVAEKIAQYQEFSIQNRVNNQNLELLTDPKIWRKNIAILATAAEKIHGQRDVEIKNSIEAAKIKADTDKLVKELLEKGIVIEDIEALRKDKKMPDTMFDSNTNSEFGYLDPKYKTAYDIIRKYIPDIHDIPITEKNTSKEQSQGKVYGEYLTIEGYKKMGIEIGKEYTAKDILKKFVLMAALPGEGIGYEGRRKLLNTLSQLNKVDGLKVKIVNNSDVPLSFNENTINIDIRYCASEYRHKDQDMGFVLAKGIIGALTTKELSDENSEFTKSMKALYEESKKYRENHKEEYEKLREEYKAKGQNFETYYGFKSLQDFVIEALTNERFQVYLSEIKRPAEKDSYLRNAFAEFVQHLKNFINRLAGKATVLDESLSIITDYITDGETITPYATPSGPIGPTEPTITNKGDFRISRSMKAKDLVDLSDVEKKILVDTFKSDTGYNKSLSDDEIIMSDEFEDWYDPSKWTIRIFINQHNANYEFEHRTEGYDVLKNPINPALCKVEQEEKTEWSSGRFSQKRVVITALKLASHKDIVDGVASIDSQPMLFSKLEIDLYKYSTEFKDKCNALVQRLIEINTKPLNDNELEEAISYLSNKGYKEKDLLELKRENPQELLRLRAYDLTYADKKKLVSVYNTDISNISSAKKLVDTNFEEATCIDDLDALYKKAVKYFSSVPESLQSMVVDGEIINIEYINKKYEEVLKNKFNIEEETQEEPVAEEPVVEENTEEEENNEEESIEEQVNEESVNEEQTEEEVKNSEEKKPLSIRKDPEDINSPWIDDIIIIEKDGKYDVYQVKGFGESLGDDMYVFVIQNGNTEYKKMKWSDLKNNVSIEARKDKSITFDDVISQYNDEHIDDIESTSGLEIENVEEHVTEDPVNEEPIDSIEEINEPVEQNETEDQYASKYEEYRSKLSEEMINLFKNCKTK